MSQQEATTQQQQATTGPSKADQFKRFFRFGMIDNSILLMSILFGFSIDNFIAKRVGARGYGALVGGCLGNFFSDGIAALPEGIPSAIGCCTGTLLPTVPVLIAMATRRPLEGPVRYALAGTCGLLFLGAFAFEHLIKDEEKVEKL